MDIARKKQMDKKQLAEKPEGKKRQAKKKSIAMASAVVVLLLALAAAGFMLFGSGAVVSLPGRHTDRSSDITSLRSFYGDLAILPKTPTSSTALSVQYPGHDGLVQYTIRWYVDGGIVKEGAEPVLEPEYYNKGETVHAEIFPSGGAGKTFRTEPVTIGNEPPLLKALSLSPPDPLPGNDITAAAEGEDPDRDSIFYRYQWTVNGDVADGITDSNTFSTKGLRKKDSICVAVTPYDGENEGDPVLSDIISLANSAPRITSIPPTSVSGGEYTYQVIAADPDGDKLSFNLLDSPPEMTIESATGLLRWKPPMQVTEKQEIFIKISVDDGDGGSASQEYSLFLEFK